MGWYFSFWSCFLGLVLSRSQPAASLAFWGTLLSSLSGSVYWSLSHRLTPHLYRHSAPRCAAITSLASAAEFVAWQSSAPLNTSLPLKPTNFLTAQSNKKRGFSPPRRALVCLVPPDFMGRWSPSTLCITGPTFNNSGSRTTGCAHPLQERPSVSLLVNMPHPSKDLCPYGHHLLCRISANFPFPYKPLTASSALTGRFITCFYQQVASTLTADVTQYLIRGLSREDFSLILH